MASPDTVVNLDEKFALFTDHWAPKILGQINDLHLKAVKIDGEFVWHKHAATDEFFLVRSGILTIQMRGRDDVTIGSSEFFIVPKGVEHRPVAAEPCEVLLIEPAGLVNTGDGDVSERTACQDVWI
ncbi:MAG: cupin domain-containing protein [Actinomycetia bacterium]|nr:cupin domain-containing protein [Actinomycetes bacterium]